MFNLLSGMNLEKLMVAFLSGMPQAKKEEWLAKMDLAQEQAAQTAADFAHIKETVDIVREQNAVLIMKLEYLTGQLADEPVTQDTTSTIENTEALASIAADNTDEILEELKEGE